MCPSVSGSSRTRGPSSVKGSSMRGGDAGLGRRSRPAPAPAPGAAAAGGPVGMMKSRWRTSANAPTTPTKATIAPMSMRWFIVVENPEWYACSRAFRAAGTGMDDASWRTSPADMAACSWAPPWCSTAVPVGVLRNAAEVCATIWLWKTAPSTAMPVAMPTWRNVLLAPEAMPLRWGCTTEMAPDARAGLTMPIPTPQAMKPGSRTVQVESAWVFDISRSPPATNTMPTPSRKRDCTRTVRRPEKKATMKVSPVKGRKRAPAASGP